jgi:uncharacterized lipoprotein
MKTSILSALVAGSVILLAACSSSYSDKPAAQATATGPDQAATAAAAQTTPAAAAPAAQAQAATPATNPVERVMGTVQSVDGDKIVLNDGKSFTLTPQVTVTRRMAATPAALQTGATVAITAKRQPDNTLLASMIVVFQMPPNGFPLGQRPMDAGNLMTNATIDKVESTGFAVSFPGGGAQISLAPDVQISVIAAGSQSDIKAGATISASVRDGAAQAVSVQ